MEKIYTLNTIFEALEGKKLKFKTCNGKATVTTGCLP